MIFVFQELKKHDVNDVVRVCEPTYKTDELRSGGITVTDLVFDDGTFPPNEVDQVKYKCYVIANQYINPKFLILLN